MKKYLAMVLLITFSIHIGDKAMVRLVFELDREKITELFCINKEKPELNCEGSCHFRKEAAQQEDKKQDQDSTPSFHLYLNNEEEAKFITFVEEEPNTAYTNPYLFMYSERHFQPPRS